MCFRKQKFTCRRGALCYQYVIIIDQIKIVAYARYGFDSCERARKSIAIGDHIQITQPNRSIRRKQYIRRMTVIVIMFNSGDVIVNSTCYYAIISLFIKKEIQSSFVSLFLFKFKCFYLCILCSIYRQISAQIRNFLQEKNSIIIPVLFPIKDEIKHIQARP